MQACSLLLSAGPSDSWAPAYVRVAVPFGATLLALLCFGQAVRLAVHVGFNIRVQGVTGGKGLELPHGKVWLPAAWVGAGKGVCSC